MSIVFNSDNKIFTLETDNTRYVIQLINGKIPVHLYYGKKNAYSEYRFQSRYRSFSPYSETDGRNYSPDTVMSEYSYFGNGDFRTTALRIRNADGNAVTRFEYKSHRVYDGRTELPGLPYADADENTQTLELVLCDDVTDCVLHLYYTLFCTDDVISRYILLENNGKNPVVIEKCMSLMLDLPACDFDMITLYGAHNDERNYQRFPLAHGLQSICSRRGASSHQFNPFMALCDKDATETHGEVYGFNFVYSGSFLDEADVDQTNGTRVQIGLGNENFRYKLEKGESFCSPEAVMTYSCEGIGKMSRNFHGFIRAHILPPEPFENRPVVLNCWEACRFDINEPEMLRFAKSAADAGIDMFVMDDGWFGKRNSDDAGLGDWYVNRDKFKNGLAPFVDKVKANGIKFGIWVEPEMVNPDSDLFRTHPEWCLHCPGRENLLGRKQLVLDMANPDVIEYLKKSFSDSFDGIPIDYFKWDMNRHMSEVGSPTLPPDRQGETEYRYMLGVYELFRWFMEHFPNAMIENCSGGGGRYDIGMMKYSTQIWTSDNTMPRDRIGIQYSSTLAYPASVMSCHVANRKNECENPTELAYRYHVALGGVLGYELHLPNVSDTVKATIKKQVSDYRMYADLIINGDLYRILNPFTDKNAAYYYADSGKTRFLLTYVQRYGERHRQITLSIPEADTKAVYTDEISGESYTGAALVQGITVKSVEEGPNSRMWYFVKQ